jgi:hypothetical protein
MRRAGDYISRDGDAFGSIDRPSTDSALLLDQPERLA